MVRRFRSVLLALALVVAGAHFAFTDEGQWTPDQIQRLDLRGAGLQIPTEQVFNPGGAGIHEAVILLGGGTGEYVSPDGLIMTNHHVAFGAVAAIATAENDYITDGYYASSPEMEIPARGYTARTVQLYEDVTDRILGEVPPDVSWEERTRRIRDASRRLLAEALGEHPDLELSISELSYGNAFKLIGYAEIEDIRIVYVPPFAVGNYGSETDNWMFPRHTGDFSFLRAYVAPDGTPRGYDPDNVPYHPRSWLRTAVVGPVEGDFVFLMGFPGRTYRYRDSYFVAYEQDSRLPYEIGIRGERIEVMTRAGEGDRDLQIRFSTTIKSLANTYKNYQGKVLGFRRQGLVTAKRAEEAAWRTWFEARPELRARYGGVLESLEAYWTAYAADDARRRAANELLYAPVQDYATRVWDYLEAMALPEEERPMNLRARGAAEVRSRLLEGPAAGYVPVDTELYTNAAIRALELEGEAAITPLQRIAPEREGAAREAAVMAVVADAFQNSPLLDPAGRERLLSMPPESALGYGGLFLQVAADIAPFLRRDRQEWGARGPEMDHLMQLYAEGIMAFRASQGEVLYPDANRSLRFSYGYVRGYDPRDAVHILPFTHLTGVMEKETGEGEFIVPEILKRAWREKDFGPFADAGGDVPVNLLSTCDTTGGNSGSPVMNARGELIGINFDRVWEATVNDYNFDPDFGRNISVDMRYILFVCRTFGANRVLEELGY